MALIPLSGTQSRPVALLILLPAAARARVVAPHLLSAVHGLRLGSPIAAKVQRLQFLFLLALDVLGEIFNGRLGRLALVLARLGLRRLYGFLAAALLLFIVFLGERSRRRRAD